MFNSNSRNFFNEDYNYIVLSIKDTRHWHALRSNDRCNAISKWCTLQMRMCDMGCAPL